MALSFLVCKMSCLAQVDSARGMDFRCGKTELDVAEHLPGLGWEAGLKEASRRKDLYSG